MSRQIRFDVTDEEWKQIYQYVKAKKKWKRVSDFARYAVFTQMDANRAGSHHKLGAGALAPQRRAV